jgi:hypothetical protein
MKLMGHLLQPDIPEKQTSMDPVELTDGFLRGVRNGGRRASSPPAAPGSMLLGEVLANGAEQSPGGQSACNQRAAASAVSSGRVLNAMDALGAALCTALITVSSNARLFGGRRMPAPITTQS